MAEKIRVAVLLSGRGSNMRALSEYKRRDPDRNYEIVLVASNVPEARGLVLAKRFGIKSWSKSHRGMDREEFDSLLDALLLEHRIEIVALAGYMRLLSTAFVEKWEGRILNIHPSLLPAFPGLDAQRQALAHGVRVSGCTVHLVDEGLDSGPIVVQRTVPVLDGDTGEALSARILAEEHRALGDHREASGLPRRDPRCGKLKES
jgi:phosphoribosylglycinamide formyltransferase-1